MVHLLLLLRLFEGLLADGVILLNDGVDLLLGANTFVDELLRVQVEDVLVLLDYAIHDGLGEHGLICLVVSVQPVADYVDNHILRAQFTLKAILINIISIL